MKLLLPVILPVLAGVLVLTVKGFRDRKNRTWLTAAVAAVLAAETVLVLAVLQSGGSLKVWQLTDTVAIAFRIDAVSRLFAVLTSVMWLLVGIYSISYMEHEENEYCFFGFYLIVLGVLIGLDFSANLITFYVFYEMMTLTSLPLVLHERTKEAVMAGLKYLFYSVAGAFLALFGIFFLAGISDNLTFTPGGVFGGLSLGEAALHQNVLAGALSSTLSDTLTSTQAGTLAGKEGLLLAAVCCMLIGFGTKAGMFPLHGWLPTAHPVAPAPASAVLSGVITKSGVLAVIRVVYYIVGPEVIRGTWIQNVWMFLTLLTVFMGSMLAYKEKGLKKRLAYSTVSQVSYILFGLSLLQPAAFVGALSHVVFHSVIKDGLFLAAGAIIVRTGWTRVEEMRGLGRVMPVTLGLYTVLSLALVGIPPCSGFISKWYLATGALASGTGSVTFIGPAVLLISALLTAGYLLPLMIDGFFPGRDFDGAVIRERNLEGKEPSLPMFIPIAVLAAAALLFGCFPGPVIGMLEHIAAAVL